MKAAALRLQLRCLELREINLLLKDPFETSFGRTTHRRIMVVKAVDDSGAVGYGECVAMEAPFYNAETIQTAWIIITQHIAPLLREADVSDAIHVNEALAVIRGNQMAKGAVEAAIWDLEARLAGQPLWKHIGGEREQIPCGVSIGLQPSVDLLLEKVARELNSGYQRIKIKIKPGKDVKLVEAVRSRFPKILLSVDANAAYSLDRDLSVMKDLDDFGLLMIEQPLEAGDLMDHAKLQRQLKTAICLDESITTVREARHALELGACRIINIKLGRVGGFAGAKEIQALAQQKGIPVWCGGMLESGIGRAHNIALSTLPGFTLPGDVSSSDRYWEEDIIDPPVRVNHQGFIQAPGAPGIGFQVDVKRLESRTVRREEIPIASSGC